MSTLLAIINKYGFLISNGLCCIKNCLGVSEQHSVVNSVCVDDWSVKKW